MDIKNIGVFYPQTLRDLPNWVLWKLEPDKDGRLTKVPYSPKYHGKASSTNPDSWGSFDLANKKLESGEYSGLGFVFSQSTGLIFLDLDHCLDDKGILTSQSKDILEIIGKNTYVEISQSGSGLHVISFGTIPKPLKYNGVEMYFNARFCAMTGRAISPCEPTDKSSELLTVYNKYKKPEQEQRPRIETDFHLNLSDEEIIKKASNSPDGEMFRKLMSGDTSDFDNDESRADYKLCKILSFWSDRDFDTISRIFYSSGLYRKKWERRDYREKTIQHAIDRTSESISEYIERKKQEEVQRLENCVLHYGGHFRVNN